MVKRVLTASELTIDLDRARQNYRVFVEEMAGVEVAAMVKADAYGLGAAELAPVFAQEGCREFFVAQVAEGIALRQVLPSVRIQVLNGAEPGTDGALVAHELVPVLNSLGQIERWQQAARAAERVLQATVHLDTGMARLGLGPDEAAVLLAEPHRLDGLDVIHVMSHLASADVAGSLQSAQQLAEFTALRRRLAHGTASLANSAGIYLGSEYHFDLGRPGVGLFGGNPRVDGPSPVAQVATLESPILQVRDLPAGSPVGYGATYAMDHAGRVATVAVGYADGIHRTASNTAMVSIGGKRVPVIGRISMDLITLDVSGVPSPDLYAGAPVEILGDHITVDEFAERAGTIPHEVLTSLGDRYRRIHIP